jgi:hypothetical protein
MILWTLILSLLPAMLLAQSDSTLFLPENLRVLGMGGAFVAVADDPQAGFLNPGGIDKKIQLGYDMSVTAVTDGGLDQIIASYLNPQSENKSAFAFGVWTQGVTRPHDHVFYVPFVGTRWQVTKSSRVGLVLRTPFRKTQHGSDKNIWAPVADLSLMQNLSPLQLGALLERAMGGSMDMIPRRLRVGAAFVPSKHLLFTYEWQGEQIGSKYNFHYYSSHFGGEVVIGKYIALRGGYAWSQPPPERHDREFRVVQNERITFGASVGLLEHGWQIGAAWDVPIGVKGYTRWSAGISYRL